MRILLIAPDVVPALDTIPEIRTITALHQVTVMNGKPTQRELYEVAQRGGYDVIHFGSHKDTYTAEDILNIARVAGVQLVFLNACYTGKIASSLVSHGIPYAISTNVELEDMNAWKFPLAFYEYIARQERQREVINYPAAYGQADNGDGEYSLSVAVTRILTMASITTKIQELEAKVNIAIRVGLVLVVVALILALF
jgi:hypothetical protein